MAAQVDAALAAQVLARSAYSALTHAALSNNRLGLALDQLCALAGLRG